MNAAPEKTLLDRRPYVVVDAHDVTAVGRALAAALDGSGPAILAAERPDRERSLPGDWWQAAARAGDAPAALVATSGSTGRPKLAMLSASALVASARATLRRIGGPGQWLLCLPVSGVAGLQVLTRSLLAGSEPVVASPSASGEELAASAMGLVGRRYTALVPTQLHRLLGDRAGAATLQQFDAVLLGGAAATQALLDRARAAGVRLVTTYGMTETAGGCVYDGRPLDGVAVAVGADRLIRIGGPTVFSGYLDGDGDSPARHPEPPGWFRTSDLGRIDDDGLLQVEGRSDDVVVSGGVNVALPSVTRTLVEHPSVAEAVAVGVADEEWGTEVVAFVVRAADGVDGTGAQSDAPPVADLRRWVADRLGRAHAPRRIVVVDAIPMLANGKPDRRLLVRLAKVP